MKKLLLSGLFITLSLITFSQTEKGTRLAGTAIGLTQFSSSKSNTSYSNSSTVYNSDGNLLVLMFIQMLPGLLMTTLP
jgi:hypothetical protein